jgi:hypothetical protein
MASLVGRAVREIYRREAIPVHLRWRLAAIGMIDFARILARELKPHLAEDAKSVVGKLVARMFERRWEVLRAANGSFDDDPRTRALALAGLYRIPSARAKSGWIVSGLGGAPRGVGERLKSELLVRRISGLARWEEVTVHLGELLIVATEDLPHWMGRSSKVLGDICFTMGARYAERTKRLFAIEDGDLSPERAIELLRMSEYVFRVNPEHWAETNLEAGTGSLEGTACPWYDRPGWHAGHCGIFGQFQAGISAAFGLKYRLSNTIPKHGGTTCKVDLVPLPSRKRA